MEQFEDIKSELQQDLRDLQQNVEQHSTFHKEALQRSVKRRLKNIYFGNLFSAIFFTILIVASTIFKIWPWWILIPFDLLLGTLVVEILIVSHDFRKADVQSRESVLSLRENMRKRSTLSKRQQIFLQISRWISWIGTPIMLIYLYLHQRDIFIPILVILFFSFINDRIWLDKYMDKYTKKKTDDFVKEIDELLEE